MQARTASWQLLALGRCCTARKLDCLACSQPRLVAVQAARSCAKQPGKAEAHPPEPEVLVLNLRVAPQVLAHLDDLQTTCRSAVLGAVRMLMLALCCWTAAEWLQAIAMLESSHCSASLRLTGADSGKWARRQRASKCLKVRSNTRRALFCRRTTSFWAASYMSISSSVAAHKATSAVVVSQPLLP